MKLIIGCPIYKRDWILPSWIRSIINQSVDLSNIGFIFEVSPDDMRTVQSLIAWKKIDKRIPFFLIKERKDIPHFEHFNNGRQWTMSKYHNMVALRNSLLDSIREQEPDYYFSLDSDVLIQNPNTIELLIGHIKNGADAVAPLMYMTPFDKRFPSVMSWANKEEWKAKREEFYPIGTYFKSDIIMAAKMMSKKTYSSINYEFHSQGEDVGWCKNAALAGLDLYSASYIYAPHIMHEEMLNNFKVKGDDRNSELLENISKV
jgi:hypothetical protein